MIKYGVNINIINDFLLFWPGYYIYIRVTSPTILNQSRLLIEVVAIKIKEDITSQKIIKKSSKEDRTNFLQMPNKISNKKRR